MKLFPISDLHLGAACSAWGRHGPRRREELRQAWTKGIDLVLSTDQGADAVLVAGDLFDRPEPDAEDAAIVIQGLERLSDAGKPVILLPGIRDGAFTANAFYHRELPKGITAVTWSEPRCLHFGIGTESFRIHCCAPVPGRDAGPLIAEDAAPPSDSAYDIGLAYAMPEILGAGEPEPGKGLDLLVVGGRPEFDSRLENDVTVISPGAPAASRPEQEGDRFWCAVELTDDGVEVERECCDVPSVITVDVEVSAHDVEDQKGLARHIESKFAGNGLVRVRLAGNVEVPWEPEELRRVEDMIPFAVRIVDDSVPSGDGAGDGSLRGRFRREIQGLSRGPEAADETVLNRALRLGLKELRRLEECHAD